MRGGRRDRTVRRCAGADSLPNLLEQVRGTRRGQLVTDDKRRREIQAAIEAVEAENDVSVEDQQAGLEGWWTLLYQAPTKSTKAMTSYEKRAVTVEGPFLSLFKPLQLVRTVSNLQRFDLEGGIVDNVAVFKVLGRYEGRLTIRGTVRQPPSDEAKSFVKFTSFFLQFGDGGWKVEVPLAKLVDDAKLPRGWLQTTYMSEPMGETRIGRGDKGSVFVAKRIPDQTST